MKNNLICDFGDFLYYFLHDYIGFNFISRNKNSNGKKKIHSMWGVSVNATLTKAWNISKV